MTDQAQTATGDTARPYLNITQSTFIHVPFAMLRQRLDWVIDNRFRPEIGLEDDTLYTTSVEEFSRVATSLHEAGLSCTLHAPFFDLAPGALDKRILETSRKKLRLAFNLLPIFKPKAIVCHLGFEENKQGYKRDKWFTSSIGTWGQLLEIAVRNHTYLMLENTYELGPETHLTMFKKLDSPWCRFCLDVGHATAFAGGTWQDWLPALEPWLGQLHLHDNHGKMDEHLPIGHGGIDFQGLFTYLKHNNLKPLITLEPHNEEHLWQTLKGIDQMQLLKFLP